MTKNINNIFHGDCLEKLSVIKSHTVDLIYLDPPFFSQKKQKLKTKDKSKEYSFDDTWPDILTYQNFIKLRLIECKRILKPTGSIFLHCDRAASHYLRIVLDEVFGLENFQSEIIWAYRRWSNAKNGLLNGHQSIYFYSKTTKFKFNPIYEDYSPTTNIDQIFQKRTRDKDGKTTYKKHDQSIELIEKKKGVPLSDVWHIPYLNPKANERVGYPTQKPILLLERIINISTDPGDLILDPFCGSGTTLVAAMLSNRDYIGIDISLDAIKLCKERLSNPIKTESALLQLGSQAYVNQKPNIIEILDIIGAKPVQRNKGIDGFLIVDGTLRPIPIKIQTPNETFEEACNHLIKASKRNDFITKILICPPDYKIETRNIEQNGLVIINNIREFSVIKKQLIKGNPPWHESNIN